VFRTVFTLKTFLEKITVPFVPHISKACWMDGESSTACPLWTSDSGYKVHVVPSLTTQAFTKVTQSARNHSFMVVVVSGR